MIAGMICAVLSDNQKLIPPIIVGLVIGVEASNQLANQLASVTILSDEK